MVTGGAGSQERPKGASERNVMSVLLSVCRRASTCVHVSTRVFTWASECGILRMSTSISLSVRVRICVATCVSVVCLWDSV